MSLLRPSRRAVLSGGLGALTAGLARRSRAAAPSRADLRFVFVRNFGGWDPTRVFATELDNAAVSYEEGAELARVGDLGFIAHADRPSVTDFFTRWAHRSLIVNGVIVPSVNHRSCERLAYTGSTAETAPDWATLLADAQAERYALPHVVIGGRSMPGSLGRSVVRAGSGGQVGKVLDGSILASSDTPAAPPDPTVEALLDAHVREAARRRAARSPGGRDAALVAALEVSLDKAATMKELGDAVRWNTDGSFASQVSLGADLLSLGLSRCVTLEYESSTWDSHEANDEKQSANFLDLFTGLASLVEVLEATAGPEGGTLADTTVLVVMSEMGRTPYVTSTKGKDHWAHGSALLVGPGITAGRVVGGFTELFYGAPVDLATGEVSDAGRELTPGVFGATLLAIGDVDGADTLQEFAPVEGVLA